MGGGGSIALRAYGRAACLAYTHLGGSGGMPPPENMSALRGHLMASEA